MQDMDTSDMVVLQTVMNDMHWLGSFYNSLRCADPGFMSLGLRAPSCALHLEAPARKQRRHPNRPIVILLPHIIRFPHITIDG